MDTTARHLFIIPPTLQATWPVQLRSRLRQATPQATPWRRFDKTGHGYAGRKIPTGKARKSRNKVSVACKRHNVCTVCYSTSLGPFVGDPTAMHTPPLRYKREEYARSFRGHASLRQAKGKAKPRADTTQARIHSEQSRSHPLETTSYTTHSGCRVLRSGGPNHSKPFVFIVFLYLDRTNPSYPRVLTLWV